MAAPDAAPLPVPKDPPTPGPVAKAGALPAHIPAAPFGVTTPRRPQGHWARGAVGMLHRLAVAVLTAPGPTRWT